MKILHCSILTFSEVGVVIVICPHYLFYDYHIALLSIILNSAPRLLEFLFPTIVQYAEHCEHVPVLLLL